MRAFSILGRFGIGCLILATGCAPATSEPPLPVAGDSPTTIAPATPVPQAAESSPITAAKPVERIVLKPKDEQARNDQGQTTPATASTDPLDAEWTMSIQPNATIQISHKGAVVVSAQYLAWAEKTNPAAYFNWAGGEFSAENVHAGHAIVKGSIHALDLKASGSITRLADNALHLDYSFTAEKPHHKIRGATLHWHIDLNSPSFEKRPADPVLLENKTGWTWQVGPGQSVTVRFDGPLDEVFFEANNKGEIRTHYISDNLEVGTRRVGCTVELPEGGRISPTLSERYGPVEPQRWFRDVLAWDGSPVDLSFLNAADRPAGRHGPLKAQGDHLVFEDGAQPRFWGGNLVAYALFSTPRPNVARQAKRMAKLGYNLMRIHQHDAGWCNPNIFLANGKQDTRHLNPKSLDALDWWIKCLKDEGIYLWIDLNSGRPLVPGDGVSTGWNEIQRHQGSLTGFNYFNSDLARLMREFQQNLLAHVNPYTKLAYKDDPAVVTVLLTNENDVTNHHGNNMLPDKNNPVHNAIFTKAYRAFARQTGLPEDRVWRTWEPGPSKIFLNDIEHQFNRAMIDDLRALGSRALVVTTSSWGEDPLSSLPALTEGDLIDVHSYGENEEMSINPRYSPNFITWIGAAQVEGKPLAISEWNTPYEVTDRFTNPLYVASIAALQGWDMPMIYCYSQTPLAAPGKEEWLHRIDKWSTFNDPLFSGVMPAAALAFRQGHISPARGHYCLTLSAEQFFNQHQTPKTSAAIRTLVEQSRLTIGIPTVKELPWLKPTPAPSGATLVTDPNHDYIPAGQMYVRSDTGELTRNWKYGIQSIDTPKTQAVIGWIGAKNLATKDAGFQISTPKAVVALSSLDDLPLSSSRSILVTAVARAVPETPNHLPYRSEPVLGQITLKTTLKDLRATTLSANGKAPAKVALKATADGVVLALPPTSGTCWYHLYAPSPGESK